MLQVKRITALALLFLIHTTVCAQEDFAVWLDGVGEEAKSLGISDATIAQTLGNIEFLPAVIKLDRAQPEFISPFLEYYYQRVDALKIAKGRAKMQQHAALLKQIELQYGVPKEVLVAFWGMETNYGSFQGNIDTFSSLATLAFDGRRAGFFRSQLFDAMRMVSSPHVQVQNLKGSWAGAFGHMQFMPTTLMTYAVDGDGDKSLDVVHSEADALASAANYLSQAGWTKNQPTMIEVSLPENFAWQDAQLLLRKPLSDWSKLGVMAVVPNESTDKDVAAKVTVAITKKENKAKLKKTKAPPKPSTEKVFDLGYKNLPLASVVTDTTLQGAILLPQGWQGPAFMVFDNFDVMLDWNRSVKYALSVAQLAKRINGESAILGGKTAETGGLSYQQMYDLQVALNRYGFDAGEPDGFPGLQTQAAIREYQLSQGLRADGYASPALLKSLTQVKLSVVLADESTR